MKDQHSMGISRCGLLQVSAGLAFLSLMETHGKFEFGVNLGPNIFLRVWKISEAPLLCVGRGGVYPKGRARAEMVLVPIAETQSLI